MRIPTEEQLAVLQDNSRVRIVKASPGSGKTWLVAELVKNELETQQNSSNGVAALSFTRVGGEEIRNALGYDLGHPHFIGTIDSFLFRFVIRPFFQRSLKSRKPPRLIPSDWDPCKWTKISGNIRMNIKSRASKFCYHLLDVQIFKEDAGRIALKYSARHGNEFVPEEDVPRLMQEKWSLWQTFGWLTHSDASYVAYKILNNPAVRLRLINALSNRFSLILIDELQDTGFFLGKCVIELLSSPSTRGVLVGDPDQSIYEFNGASPQLFDDFTKIPGSRCLELSVTLRCSDSVLKNASFLKDSVTLTSSAGSSHSEGSLILSYDDMLDDCRRLALELTHRYPSDIIKIITRNNRTISNLCGLPQIVKPIPSLHSISLNHLLNAVRAFRSGKNATALAQCKSSLGVLFFDDAGIDEQTIHDQGILIDDWRSLVIGCLIKCANISFDKTLFDWQMEAAEIVETELNHIDSLRVRLVKSKCKPHKRSGWDQPVTSFLPIPLLADQRRLSLPVQTIHSVKGETHDITILLCPPITRFDKCPSVSWWPELLSSREDRRIAYVALTRAKNRNILLVCKSTFESLKSTRRDFFDSFIPCSVDEYLSFLNNRTPDWISSCKRNSTQPPPVS